LTLVRRSVPRILITRILTNNFELRSCSHRRAQQCKGNLRRRQACLPRYTYRSRRCMQCRKRGDQNGRVGCRYRETWSIISKAVTPVLTQVLHAQVIGASQKGLGVPPGLCVVCASPKAIDAFKARKAAPTSYFASWNKWLPVMEAYSKGAAAYFATPPVVSVTSVLGMEARVIDFRPV
jgi:hypothetical protein